MAEERSKDVWADRDTASEFRTRFVELMAGLALAVMLTLAFMGPLHLAGHLGLCAAAIALPLLAAFKVSEVLVEVGSIPSLPAAVRHFDAWGMVLAVLSLVLLLYEVYWPAAIVFAVALVGVALLVTHQIGRHMGVGDVEEAGPCGDG